MDAAVWGAVWPEWQFKNVIGRGAYGVVYRAVRFLNGKEEAAAIKVVSFPQDEIEISQLKAEGMTEEETKNYYASMANELYEEIQTMKKLNGTVSIVNVQDSAVIPQSGQIGWNILIRMECLTPFAEYIDGRTLTEAEVITLGIDLCRALEVCEEKHILHRDVKPENIFVGADGHFKLGDFGIARQLEMTTGVYTRVGTPLYAAPEVAEGKRYDRRADIYSLGLVLYRLMNGGRLPFMPEKRLLTPADRRNALEKRLGGETVPAPADASAGLAGVILRACAPKVKDRYENASAFREALEGVRKAAAVPWWKRRGFLAAGLFLAVFAAVGAGLWFAARTEGGVLGRFAGRAVSLLGGLSDRGSGESGDRLPAADASTETDTGSAAPSAQVSDHESAPPPTVSDTAEKISETESAADTADASEAEELPPAESSETEAVLLSETEAPSPSETPEAVTAHIHHFSEWSTAEAASCSRTGLMIRRCGQCGAEETETIPKTAHTFSGWSVSRAATCAQTGVKVRRCTVCGAQETASIPKTDHTWGEWIVTVQPFCGMVDGEKERTCPVCGATEKDSMIIHTAHWFEPWTDDPDRPPTCTDAGYDIHVCQYCGYVESRRGDAPLGHEFGTDGTCVRCGTDLLSFRLAAGGMYYIVDGFNPGAADAYRMNMDLVIPAVHDGLPVEVIAGEAFAGKFFYEVKLPETLRKIEAWAFKYATIDRVTLPSSLISANDAFCNADIRLMTFAEGTVTPPLIGSSECGVKELILPDSMISWPLGIIQFQYVDHWHLGSSVRLAEFGSAPASANYYYRAGSSLHKEITVSAGNPYYRVVQNCLIEKDTGRLLATVIPYRGHIDLPAGAGIRVITKASVNGFEQYTLTIPDGVEEIETGAIAGSCIVLSLPNSLRKLEPKSIVWDYGVGERIEFRGTMAEWEQVEWTHQYDQEPFNTCIFTICCTDSDVEVDTREWTD